MYDVGQSRCMLCGILILSCAMSFIAAETGCSYQAEDGGFPDTRMAACKGKWYGHVKYAGNLCAPGWQVCDWKLDGGTLNKISWTVALSVDGCYAYNAAHDGGRCRECRNQLEQDDMAGIGRGCPHQHQGQGSCINGGRIDASCCVDSHISLNRGCQQQSWIDGVMCCRQSAKKPHILAPPPERIDVNVGRIFMLSCQAEGMPTPHTQWYKDGSKIGGSRNSRISVLTNGDLLVTLTKKSDSGQYSCEVINEEGIDIAHSQVFVKDHDSGCEDGTTEGLEMHSDIHACAGRWKGHVKHGSMLCGRGWRVCNSHDTERLENLSWLDIFDVKGCYAYNVANHKSGKCRRCHSGKGRLAGIGRDCRKVYYNQPSCLAQGRIDVYRSKKNVARDNSCGYQEGITTGVLCCKRHKRKNKIKNEVSGRPHCSLGCENGGQCVGYNVCMCPVGYKGAMCQNAVCPDGCGSRAKCVSPGKCECIHPYTGKNCSEKKHKMMCKSPCLNGGRCRKGKCKCPPTHYGSSCQHLYKHLLLSHLNRTER